MKILFCGLPGSGKTTIASTLATVIASVHINADAVREYYNDWDFTSEGRLRQANRMKYLADGVKMAGRVAIADFVAPTEKTRNEFGADYIVWMDTINEGRFEDTNKIFESVTNANYVCKDWQDSASDIINIVKDINRILKENQQ